MNEALRPYLDRFRSLPPSAPSWLRALKETALQRATAAGFPQDREEAWKYTSVRALEKRGFTPSAVAPLPGASDLEALRITGLEAARAVFVNGRFQPALSTLPAGLRALPLDAHEDRSDLLTPLPGWEQDVFLNLNTTLFEDGVLLELMPECKLESPVEILHVVAGDKSSHHSRCVLRLGAGSAALVIERFADMGPSSHLTNAVCQIQLEPRAELEHVRLQTENTAAFHIARVFVRQGAGSRYRSRNLQLGSQWSRLDLHARLEAEGAEALLDGLYAVNGRRHVDNHTRIDHLVPHTVSAEHYRGILEDRGRAVFNGKVVVAPHAVKTDAQQANHNLMLSAEAEIDTKPELEIYADDVKCSHGATIGELDDRQLFYLRSRGLDAEAARALLVSAFANQLIERLPHPALAAHVRARFGRIATDLKLPEQT